MDNLRKTALNGFSCRRKYYSRAFRLSDSLSIPNIKIRALRGLGRTEHGLGNSDKAIDFLLRAFELADSLDKKGDLKNVYAVLSKVYESRGEYVRALEYYKLYTQMKDSLFNEEKSKDIGKLEAKYEFEKEQEKEKRIEIAESLAKKEAEQRRNNLQYSGISIFLVLLVVALMMAGNRKPSPLEGSVPKGRGVQRLLEGLIFLTFLLFFEFLLVLLDSQIEEYSGGEPAYKLLFNASIAALIFPLHALFERKLKGRLAM